MGGGGPRAAGSFLAMGLSLEVESLRQTWGVHPGSAHTALPQDTQELVGRRRKSWSSKPGSHGGSRKGREGDRPPSPHGRYQNMNDPPLLEHLLYSRHSERVSRSPQPHETLTLQIRNLRIRDVKSFV